MYSLLYLLFSRIGTPYIGPASYFSFNDPNRKDLTEEEHNILLCGSRTKGGERFDKKLEGVCNQFKRLVLMKGVEGQADNTMKKIARFVYECECSDCKEKRLNPAALSCRINGYNINEMCEMEFSTLRCELDKIHDE